MLIVLSYLLDGVFIDGSCISISFHSGGGSSSKP